MLLGASWRNLEITAASERERVRTPCVFVGNNSYVFDRTSFGARTRLDQGELCVHVVKQQTRIGVLLLPLRIALNLTDRVRDIETFRVTKIEITSRSRHLQVSLDGEIAAMKSPLRYRSRPGALCVLAHSVQPSALEPTV